MDYLLSREFNAQLLVIMTVARSVVVMLLL